MLRKLCECGCGEAVSIAPVTSKARGYVAGQPYRFVQGHGRRGAVQTAETRARISAGMMGHPVSRATREKISRGTAAGHNRGAAEREAAWDAEIRAEKDPEWLPVLLERKRKREDTRRRRAGLPVLPKKERSKRVRLAWARKKRGEVEGAGGGAR